MSLTPNQIAAYRWGLEREGFLQRPVSPSTASVASTVSNAPVNNMLARRNAAYTRKANQWKANVAAGKVNLTPYNRKAKNAAMSRAAFYEALGSVPASVAPVHTNVAQWRPLAAANNAARAQKQADLAAYFAAMKSKKPAKNVRHTTGRAARKSRKTRRNRRN
jgi:hypothetical protein